MPRVARSVPANRGIEAKYRAKLQSMVAEMQASIEYWLTAAYRKEPPRVAELAEDALPSQKMAKVLNELRLRWMAKFDEAAPLISDAYLKAMFRTSDAAFKKALKDAGLAVEFKMTQAMRDAFQAKLTENVSLIKSIPAEYLQKVEGAVMRGYAAGRDLQSMVKELRQLYPEAAHRAELIARDQSNKANAVVNRTRSMELGIEEAIWMHSHAGKTPRPSHVAANGKRFKIAQGMLIDGEYIQPGEEINCRCTYRIVLPY